MATKDNTMTPERRLEIREEMFGYPKIQTGGSLMIAWQIKGKRVLLVGGGEVAATRLVHLLSADALVTMIAPAPLHPEVAFRLTQFPQSITWIDRPFQSTDLTSCPNDYSLILTAIDDPVASSEIYTLAQQLKIPANIADVPPECDFYFGSVHRDGPLQVMVSTNGNGPRMASTIRKMIAEALPEDCGRAIERMGKIRQELRKLAPEQREGKRRMEWIKQMSDKYPWDAVAGMSDEDMQNLLEWYFRGQGEGEFYVPEWEELIKMRKGKSKWVREREAKEREEKEREEKGEKKGEDAANGGVEGLNKQVEGLKVEDDESKAK
ncbi:siroheme synthase middle domains-like protein [Sordaria brevicollis]|uniref:precorrin-2 dehydrogenase n=1 Tax=Sordaria brevicollis TaxID=83679 RepID=A0AAE0PGY3_SORBR|nr:siroheme synthase middle domains-like protein [Sordaria brevicollis]